MALLSGVGASGATAQISVSELRNLELEDLMAMEVTSVSRRPEPFYATAGAVSVLTNREIAQTGARRIADALRYVPGVQVARVDSRTWAITVRGFNAPNPNKLLVLMDGRSVYTPLFSGVLWDAQSTMLADIDRIEIVRGPGATMWGANAVNGVISITTKDARYTQGGLISAGVGTEELAFAEARYGGEVPGKLYYRVYAKTSYQDDMQTEGGDEGLDDWRMTQTGFRIDSATSKDFGGITFQGDYYDGSVAVPGAARSPLSGGNLLLRGTRRFSGDLDVTSQLYFDHVSRVISRQYGEVRNTYDFDTQIHYQGHEGHDIVGGFNYRSSSDHTTPAGTVFFAPAERRMESVGAFVQDEMRWGEGGRYGLILGSKFEHHESVGFEIQPSVRGAIRSGRNTYWASVSRAVRTPSRYDEDSRFPNVTRPLIVGTRGFESEVVIAYEVGYRGQPLPGLTWDVSLFFNDYDKLRSFEPSPGRNPNPRIISNLLQAETYGGEVSLRWQPIERWSLQASYSHLKEHFRAAPGSRDTSVGTSEANDPEHQAVLRSVVQLPGDVEWSLGLRFVDSLPYPEQDWYLTADTRLLWRFRGGWELALVGQNLAEDAHTEFGANSAREVERGFYGSVTWQF